jgi:hypothetical protein
MGRVAADLVAPVANMLLAALAAGGLAGDEQRQQDPAGASGAFGDCLCQSSLAQVYGHTESTARQYALADDATRLGYGALHVNPSFRDAGHRTR